MLEEFVSSFAHLVEPTTVLFLAVGIAIGMVVGLLPGLGSTVTLALMLPFIFSMTPFQAFAFLLGMYAVTTTTGDLTSILIGVPGEATSAALVLDGYPMTKNGEAARALGAAVASSAVGAVIGAVALALSVPIARPFVLALGAPELFMLSVLGVSMVGALSGRSLLRGVIAGGIGLLLSAVGPESQHGITRYGFDLLYLLDGVPLIPLVVGLFAIPELIDLHTQRTSIARAVVDGGSRAWTGVIDTFRHFWLVFRCSMIGVAIGVLPGISGGLSQWLAYAHAVQSSRQPERFGKGAVEGVLGPGACNNSKEGGALIPTIAFGVPGSSAMAVLLGAFLIVGLQPGPRMLTTNLDVTFFMVWVLVVANIIGAALSFALLNPLAKLTFIRGTLLVPLIVLIVFIGSLGSSSQIEDLVVTILFGGLAWVMHRLGWPIPPLLLGFVLGDRAEANLWISSRTAGFTWLGRPLVILLVLITLAVIVATIRQYHRRPVATRSTEREASPRWQLAFSAALLLIAVWAVITAQAWPAGARLFPSTIGLFTAACALVQLPRELGRVWRSHAVKPELGQAARGPEDDGPTSRVVMARTGQFFGWIVGLFVGVWLVGLSLTVVPFTVLYLKFVSKESWRTSLAIAAGAGIFHYGILVTLLRVSLPSGLLVG